MRIKTMGSNVRILYYGAPSYTVRVERRKQNVYGKWDTWATHWETDERSNDYAYSEALRIATRLAADILTGESP